MLTSNQYLPADHDADFFPPRAAKRSPEKNKQKALSPVFFRE